MPRRLKTDPRAINEGPSSNNTRKPAEGHFLFNCLAKKGQTLIASLENDGISDHISGGVSLVVDVMKSGDGKSLMNAQLVRNMDSEKVTPVDKIKVKDKG